MDRLVSDAAVCLPGRWQEGPGVPLRLPWLSRVPVEKNRAYLAMISYFRLKGLRVMPGFALNALRIERQLLRSDGLIAHSSGAKPRSLEFWSVTV